MKAAETSRILSARVLGAGSLGLAAFCLSACATGTPATITSAQGSTPNLTSVTLLGEEDTAGLRAQFRAELSRALAARGSNIRTDADFIADFAVSEHEAQLSLQEISEDSDGADLSEDNFKSRWYDNCKPNRVSASLVLYSRASGEIEAKSSGEFLACPGDHSELGKLADLLVARAAGS